MIKLYRKQFKEIQLEGLESLLNFIKLNKIKSLFDQQLINYSIGWLKDMHSIDFENYKEGQVILLLKTVLFIVEDNSTTDDLNMVLISILCKIYDQKGVMNDYTQLTNLYQNVFKILTRVIQKDRQLGRVVLNNRDIILIVYDEANRSVQEVNQMLQEI